MDAKHITSATGIGQGDPNRQQPLQPPPDSHEAAYRCELERQNAELQEAHEALEAARDRYMDLYDSAPVGFITLGRQGVILEANLTAAEMLGLDHQKLIKRPLAGFLAQGESQQLFTHLGQARHHQARATTELRLQAHAEEALTVRLDTVLSRSADGAPAYFVTLTDLSEQKRLEAESRRHHRELEQLSRTALVGEIASTLGHDLNQPLAAISNYATAARYNLNAPDANHERTRESLDKLDEQVEYAGDLIRSVRDMLRPCDAVQETLDLNRVAEESRGLVAKYAEEHQIRLRTELGEDLPSVTGNATQLKQVVVNLAVNAVEAYNTDDGPAEVAIRTSEGANGEVVLAVSDTAGGMDEETRQHLFDPFYSTKGEGLGMGLAICRTIVENHGGALWALTNDQGGTTLRFRLPVE